MVSCQAAIFSCLEMQLINLISSLKCPNKSKNLLRTSNNKVSVRAIFVFLLRLNTAVYNY